MPAPKAAKPARSKTSTKRRAASKKVATPTTVRSGVEQDLAQLAERDPALATSTLAMSALRLAREMDSDNSATSKSMCAKALLDTMDRLWELAPPVARKDGIDELKAHRDKKRARIAQRGSRAANPKRS